MTQFGNGPEEIPDFFFVIWMSSTNFQKKKYMTCLTGNSKIILLKSYKIGADMKFHF